MIEWAAVKANCDFVNHFPDKFDTNIGPRGSLLSGGQKQKVAIARCLIKDPPVLILDEATSALDSKSESAINKTLSNLLRDQSITTISIAHRLSTIEKCDDILVLGYNGEIVEHGKFKELYADHESRLYKLLNEDHHYLETEQGANEDEEEKLKREKEEEEKKILEEQLEAKAVPTEEEYRKKLIEEQEKLSEELKEEGETLKDNFMKQKFIIPDHFTHDEREELENTTTSTATSSIPVEEKVKNHVDEQRS
ncbi:unnamed protein product [Ambrosiozyma monospora]|uniref:Unnamed protein product n=1 Tax=Ambrosiozyma monospora TaxID=43982 RepID=A0ACB5TDV4_AMBMO|nr:unnamed protein product [Ambrosiozyma monospora]